MQSTLRSVLAVVAGSLAAIVVVTLFDASSLIFFPIPAGADPADPAALVANSAEIPLGSYVVLIVGWGAASFIGATIAARVADRAHLIHGLGVTGLLLVTGILNLLALPHPVWVWVFGLAAYAGGGWLGALLAARSQVE